MKAVKEAKRPTGSRGRTGRDGAIDFALKIEESATVVAAMMNTSIALSKLSVHRHAALRPLSNLPLPAPTPPCATCVGSR